MFPTQIEQLRLRVEATEASLADGEVNLARVQREAEEATKRSEEATGQEVRGAPLPALPPVLLSLLLVPRHGSFVFPWLHTPSPFTLTSNRHYGNRPHFVRS